MGTIEKGLQLVRGYTATSDNSLTDEDFISFLESLKEVQTKTFDVDTLEALGEFVSEINPYTPLKALNSCIYSACPGPYHYPSPGVSEG